ncbi:MAG: ABC transporter permease [Anaerolineales bacterium]|nr:ABC transporter permease [Chloroflexota bacterium]MBL6982617.1 ABC transporter permease [Anaerolineales bacterium]
MKLEKIIKIASQGLVRNKLRSLLTMLGVIIGVSAVIIMIAISAGTEAMISDQITSLGTNLVFVQANFSRGGFGGEANSGGLVYDDAFAIADGVSGVQAVVVEQQSSETVKAGNISLDSISILGTTEGFPSVRDMEIAEGRYFNQAEIDRNQKVVVLGSSLAEELFEDQPPVGQTVTIGTTKFTVIGVFEEKGLVGEVDYDARVYMPITVVFQKYTPSQFARIMGDRVRLIYVELEPDVVQGDVILQIELLLAKLHDVSLEEPDFIITTQQDLINTQEATTEAFRNLLAWVAAVSLLVGGIGIMNIMMVSVTERTREIGIRQSVGASPNDIRWQFLTEALLLSLVGGLIGVITGVGGSWLFGALGEMRTVVVPSSIMLAFSSAAAVGIFFGYYPADKAAQLDPIEALRHE